MSADEAALRERSLAGLAAFQRLIGAHARGARLLEGRGWVGSVVPASPDVSLANAVVVQDTSGLVELLPGLEAAYGPEIKWGVWVEGDDRAARSALEAAGLVLDSEPVVQGAALAEIHGLDGSGEAEPVEPSLLAAINDLAYGLPPGTLEHAFADLPPEAFRARGLRHEGEIRAVGAHIPGGDDAHVAMIATHPSAQRRGLGSRVLRALLRDARELGCRTTTLEASRAGAGVYRALGYRDLGRMLLYERRP
jgi:ribosomal protein S18 acetylase RimI-like enzyme